MCSSCCHLYIPSSWLDEKMSTAKFTYNIYHMSRVRLLSQVTENIYQGVLVQHGNQEVKQVRSVIVLEPGISL